MNDLITSAVQSGSPAAVLVAFMVWQANARAKIDRDRIESDKETTKALTTISERISQLMERMNHVR